MERTPDPTMPSWGPSVCSENSFKKLYNLLHVSVVHLMRDKKLNLADFPIIIKKTTIHLQFEDELSIKNFAG